jgi:hypothetical protein
LKAPSPASLAGGKLLSTWPAPYPKPPSPYGAPPAPCPKPPAPYPNPPAPRCTPPYPKPPTPYPESPALCPKSPAPYGTPPAPCGRVAARWPWRPPSGAFGIQRASPLFHAAEPRGGTCVPLGQHYSVALNKPRRRATAYGPTIPPLPRPRSAAGTTTPAAPTR